MHLMGAMKQSLEQTAPSRLLLLTRYSAAYKFTQAQAGRLDKPAKLGGRMDMNQIMYDLTYWFDFIILVVRHHPLMSVATALVAFLLYQALSVMKLIGTIISFGLAVVTAILLQMFM
jgi:hypothetical protein